MPGLPQGYVAFDTIHCQILRLLHTEGDLTGSALAEAIDYARPQVATSIRRLADYGYIFHVDYAPNKDTGKRTEMVWSLKKRREALKCPHMTRVERSARYRLKLKMRAPSVFQFRGQVKLV